ncbi:type II toxin-antitoxin system RelE/ParE family toxin [Legionella cardiaca]|uniref:Type II toxin-antitoxin system RelE/ParE family toxin n=1 Tax=Legionella cardiaca TaxID=1071983 RepID=A0ABY8AU98_9GAMM|nr:type II toxin-antitoxin system RelE/ParE family toxin [Legionella cardiaca]WED44009.1 type II toxin-antitoxin system RelE/ParE family toxin [Legionella cardiaca]
MRLPKILTAVFYRKLDGFSPVRDWLKSLGKADKKIIGADIHDVECYWPVGMPKVKYLQNRLWEVRSNVTENKSARIFFTTKKENMVLLHGFFKKSRKTPQKELDIALERKNDVFKGGGL